MGTRNGKDELVSRVLSFLRERMPPPEHPPLLGVEVNEVCASRCIHCSFGTLRYPDGVAPLEDLVRAVRDAGRYGCRVMTVGAREPFLDSATARRTIRVLLAARDAGFTRMGVVSSARFLPRAMAELPEHGLRLNVIDVSVDGVGAGHDAVRGVGEAPALEAHLDRSILQGIAESVGASVTVHRHNLQEVQHLLDWLAEGRRGPRVDVALFATMYVSARNDPGSMLAPGDFERLVHTLEERIDRDGTELPRIVVEVTPDSLPDWCDLVEQGVLDPAAVCLTETGMPVIRRLSGLEIRVLAGAFSYGCLVVIRADGKVRLGYGQDWDDALVGSVRETPLFDLLRRYHGDGGYLELIARRAALGPAALACPAWPLHLERCPRLGHPGESKHSLPGDE